MGLLSDLTRLNSLVGDVELLDVDLLEFEHLELDDGRDFLLALVTGPQVEKVVELLERLRTWSQPAPNDMGRLTNTQLVEELMEFPRSGPLMQAFVMQALSAFSKGVLASRPGSLGNAMVSEEAWRACASEVLEKLKQERGLS
ncbi:MAG TPA: hypothetical protein VGE28_19365 [Pseudomonas sp.]